MTAPVPSQSSALLRLQPGAMPGVVGERPTVGRALLDRVTAGRRAALLPDLLATAFTVSKHAQRSTARRAVLAALGLVEPAADAARGRLATALHLAHDQLLRLAVDLPARAGGSVDTGWLLDAPVMGLPVAPTPFDLGALQAASAALPGWLGRWLYARAPADWLHDWHVGGGDALARWCEGREQPIARWLSRVQADARRLAWPCVPLPLPAQGDAGWHELAASIAAHDDFGEHPVWHGAPAETGPWTRARGPEPAATAWERIGARLADLAHIACGRMPMLGALTIAQGEGIAWTEAASGLLVHWIRLEPGERDPATARAERYCVITSTEWNFHQAGAYSRLVAQAESGTDVLRLGVAVLDPCASVEFTACDGVGP